MGNDAMEEGDLPLRRLDELLGRLDGDLRLRLRLVRRRRRHHRLRLAQGLKEC